MSAASRRRLLVPEVVQTSAMDCGPAALAAAAQGLGVRLSYARLREACQTDVDGTSINALEDISKAIGLEATQSMAPLDHLLLPETEATPSIVVVVLEGGMTHFVVLWRVHGPLVQLMDPAVGRRWVSKRRFLDDVYIHEQRLPADAWMSWAASDSWRDGLLRRAARLGAAADARAMYEAAVPPGGATPATSAWLALARLDAAVRFVEDVAEAGGVARGGAAARLVATLARGEGGVEIPPDAWSVRAAPPVEGATVGTTDGARHTEDVILRGAVFLTLGGRKAGAAAETPTSRTLAAALDEKPVRPWLEVVRWTLRGGLISTLVLMLATLVVAAGTVVEGVVLRALLEVGQDLTLVPQRLTALGVLGLFLGALLLLELGIAGGLARLGRQLEVRMRVALSEKIPRLSDRYFQTRPVSDMAERGHSLHQLRVLPRVLGELVRAVASLALTAVAIVWIDPDALYLAAAAAAAAVIVPLLFAKKLAETDLRTRTHTGALGRFYLDALLGLAPLRAHGAERAVRREHESLLVEWSRSTAEFVRTAVRVDAIQAIVGFGGAFLLVQSYAARGQSPTTVLLLAFWALALPMFGDEIARVVRQLPIHRNLFLRAIEPLRTPEEESAPQVRSDAARAALPPGADLAFEGVRVVAAGHTVLDGVDLKIPPGSHVAVVGASGAGKSSFAALLLGWHRAEQGRVVVDGETLDRARLERLRRETVWIDPAVRLWNRSLLDNIAYGNDHAEPLPVAEILAAAELHRVVDRLPQGLQTDLGEGGGLLSGGEGQRVRFARGLARAAPRLVILDEPFRGLPRDQRRLLLDRARAKWRGATILWITHDVTEAQTMERVLVLDAGRVVEDGLPADLAARAGSKFRALLDGEEAVRRAFWDDPTWRRLRLEEGRVREASVSPDSSRGFA
ncbi:MAG: ATP-binding cassette domain-containing protein [Planctomycetes bacterium]|nr:ATP-binding cassette domain-containing protein [Planctomycetota bacterium]